MWWIIFQRRQIHFMTVPATMKLLKCSVKVWISWSKFIWVSLFSSHLIRDPSTYNFFFSNMNGIEYILLHVQGPILYVIRKQHRHSPSDVTPIADYYIIAGTVYQAPDLASVFNSRLVCRNLTTHFSFLINRSTLIMWTLAFHNASLTRIVRRS